MSGQSAGTNIQNLNQGRLSSYVLSIPDYSRQCRIADILSAYDALIENNQKQIKLLEEAAQRLYKEWFVDLRFPGYETVRFVDGVPEGWQLGRAYDFFDITIGKTPPRAEKQWFVESASGVPWVSISDMGEAGTYVFGSSEDITTSAIERHNMNLCPAGTILLSFKLTIGRVSITAREMYNEPRISDKKAVASKLTGG